VIYFSHFFLHKKYEKEISLFFISKIFRNKINKYLKTKSKLLIEKKKKLNVKFKNEVE
jgi:hypothetical protein